MIKIHIKIQAFFSLYNCIASRSQTVYAALSTLIAFLMNTLPRHNTNCQYNTNASGSTTNAFVVAQLFTDHYEEWRHLL